MCQQRWSFLIRRSATPIEVRGVPLFSNLLLVLCLLVLRLRRLRQEGR